MILSRKLAVALVGAGVLSLVPSLVLGTARLPDAARDCSVTCANGSKCSCTGKCSCTCNIWGNASCQNLK